MAYNIVAITATEDLDIRAENINYIALPRTENIDTATQFATSITPRADGKSSYFASLYNRDGNKVMSMGWSSDLIEGIKDIIGGAESLLGKNDDGTNYKPLNQEPDQQEPKPESKPKSKEENNPAKPTSGEKTKPTDEKKSDDSANKDSSSKTTTPIPNDAEKCFETLEDSYQTPWNREQQDMWYTPIPKDETNRYRPIPQGNHKPTIEFFGRDVKYTGEQHGYTIFTFSDARQVIVTGFPENMNMIAGNLMGVIIDYDKDNYREALFPKGDWKDNKSRKLIQKWEFSSDQELNSYLSQAKQAIDFVNTGNNGGKFDYDLCKSDACWGANSNTVQKLLFEKMNLNLHIPKDISLPGIEGKFFDGLMDNYFQKVGAELQKEQP